MGRFPLYFFVLSSPLAPVARSVSVLIVKDYILFTVLKLISGATPNISLMYLRVVGVAFSFRNF